MTARKNKTPEKREARREYQREYRAKPENKARQRRWLQERTPEQRKKYRAYQREYQRKLRATPEGVADAKRRKAKYRAKPETKIKEREYNRKRQKANPARARDYTFKRLHGVTRDKADAMAEAQGNLCAICQQPPSGKKHCGRLHVDHCHETDKIRGMLCSNCNKALGHMKDDPARLQAAIEYLRSN